MAPLLPYSAGRSTWCHRKPLVGEVAPGSSASEQPEGGGSVNGFFSKVARFAVSKMAAFCYAVAVGVAGNLVFHYVQTHEAVPSVAATHREMPPAADKPPVVEPVAAVIAKPAPPPAIPVKPVALPEPAAVNLPTAAAMSLPPLKPAALPSNPAPVEAAVQPAPPPS